MALQAREVSGAFEKRALCVTYGLSLSLPLVPALRVFFRVLLFSSLHKNQHYKFQFDPEMRATGLLALLLSVILAK